MWRAGALALDAGRLKKVESSGIRPMRSSRQKHRYAKLRWISPQPPLRPDLEAMVEERQPHHRFRIDQGTPDRDIERRQSRADLAEIDEPAARRRWSVECGAGELVEQRTLRHLPWPHHCHQLPITRGNQVCSNSRTRLVGSIPSHLPPSRTPDLYANPEGCCASSSKQARQPRALPI
jgi:hypothetical protein